MPLCSCGRPDTFQAVRITKRQIMRENTIPAGLSFYTIVCRKAASSRLSVWYYSTCYDSQSLHCPFIFASFALWSAAIRLSMISSRSPTRMVSSLCRVSLIRWSVTRPWGKL